MSERYALLLRTAERPSAPVTLARDAQRQYFAAVLQSAEPDSVRPEATGLLLIQGAEERRSAIARAGRFVALAKPYARVLAVTAGIGRVHEGEEGLRRSAAEAERAASIGRRVWGEGGVYHFANLGIYQILDRLEPNDDLAAFLSVIDQLVAYEQESRIELVRTLEAYFACKGNVRKASEMLFAHYNTVTYRLERIQQITGLDLEEPGARLHLQVALQAARLFGRLEPGGTGHGNTYGLEDEHAAGEAAAAPGSGPGAKRSPAGG